MMDQTGTVLEAVPGSHSGLKLDSSLGLPYVNQQELILARLSSSFIFFIFYFLFFIFYVFLGVSLALRKGGWGTNDLLFISCGPRPLQG